MFACVLACLVVLCLFCFCVCFVFVFVFVFCVVFVFGCSFVRPFVRSFVGLFVCVFVLFSLISFCFVSFRLVSCGVGWLVGRSVGRLVVVVSAHILKFHRFILPVFALAISSLAMEL